MDEGQDLRVDAYQGSWGGHAQGGAQEQSRQRRHQLHVLFDALDEGALDAARQALPPWCAWTPCSRTTPP